MQVSIGCLPAVQRPGPAAGQTEQPAHCSTEKKYTILTVVHFPDLRDPAHIRG